MSEQKAVIHIGTLTLDAVIDIELACTHPELNMKQSMNVDERIYWCSVCKKKIIVPMYQSSLNDRNAQENFGGMIELAFGERWGKLAREGKV